MTRLISLIAFLIMTIIVWWSITNSYIEENEIQLAKSERYVEIFMNEFEMTAMDATGKSSYKLTGKHLERYNDSDNSIIEQPVFHILQADKQWVISADIALVNDHDETIQLKQNVVMQQKNFEPALTIRTQNMLIHTKTQIAQTKAQVDITQGNSHLKSIGMIYNNITSELELSSSVSGYYLPYD